MKILQIIVSFLNTCDDEMTEQKLQKSAVTYPQRVSLYAAQVESQKADFLP